jgi:hypothetical protein
MKRFAILGVCFVVALALAGCGQSPSSPAQGAQGSGAAWGDATTPTPAVSDAAPVASPTAEATPTPAVSPAEAAYSIEGVQLVMGAGSAKSVIYDAAEQYGSGWKCELDNLVTTGDALYLTEGGWPVSEDDVQDDTQGTYRIVRLNRDGSGRQVLYEQEYVGFLQLLPFGERLMFVSDGFDSVGIGWVSLDGSAWDWLDFTEYAAGKGVEPEYNSAELYFVGGDLNADITFFARDADGNDELVDDTVWIKPDLVIESAVD